MEKNPSFLFHNKKEQEVYSYVLMGYSEVAY